MSDSLRICAVALIVISAIAIIKQISSDFVFPLRAAATVLFSSLLLLAATPVIEYVNELFSLTGFSRFASPILRGFGIAMLSQGCASVCRDCGEGSVASFVELAGKIEIFILCIPLISELLALSRRFLEMQ